MYFKRKRSIPEINSSSSADIAFLLLIFFLLTSSIDKTQGIYRRMSPPNPETAVVQKKDILKENLLRININAENQLIVDKKGIEIKSLAEIVKEFLGKEDHVIALQISENADYETYISVLNELTKSYNLLRDQYSETTFGKVYKLLDLEERASVREKCPQNISERIIKDAL